MRKMLLAALAAGGLALGNAGESQAQSWGIQIGVGQPGGYARGYYAPNYYNAYPRYHGSPGYYNGWNNPGYSYYNRPAWNNGWNGNRYGYHGQHYNGHYQHHHHR